MQRCRRSIAPSVHRSRTDMTLTTTILSGPSTGFLRVGAKHIPMNSWMSPKAVIRAPSPSLCRRRLRSPLRLTLAATKGGRGLGGGGAANRAIQPRRALSVGAFGCHHWLCQCCPGCDKQSTCRSRITVMLPGNSHWRSQWHPEKNVSSHSGPGLRASRRGATCHTARARRFTTTGSKLLQIFQFCVR